MKSIFLLTILIILNCILLVFPQDAVTDPVARVGIKKITKEEYIKRYEFTPGLQRQSKSKSETAKLEFLYTLIAEKLWAQEAIALGLDKTEVMEFSRREFQKLFVRDALYKKEILDKIQISKDDFNVGVYRYRTTLKVYFIFSESEKKIHNLYSLLVTGIDFDSILSVRPEAEEQVEPIEIVYGQMADAIEDSLYNLKTGEFTVPILTPDGWYIFKLSNRIETMFGGDNDMETAKKEVERIIKARKSRILYTEYYVNFFGDKKVDVNPVLFNSLAEKISERFEWREKNDLSIDKNLSQLRTDDVLFIEEQFGTDSLNMSFLIFETNPISLKQFIRIMAFDGFTKEGYEKDIVGVYLDDKIRTIIEQEMLAREGFNRGYNLLPEVQEDVNMWVDNYLFQVLQNKFIDSVQVTDDDVEEYYNATHTEKSGSSQPNQLTNRKSMDDVRRQLKFKKAKGKMNNYTVNLAIKYGVGIDFDLLDSVEVTNINSFGIRGLGFGGRLTAVPILAPNVEWVQPWLNQLKVIQ
jgi:parvulin-like peptidyl-prolyl isomerase